MTPESNAELKVGMELKGKIKKIELYGAFVDIGTGQDALLHVSQLGKPNVRNVEDVVKTGEEVTVYILKVDQTAGRVALSLVKPPTMAWDDLQEGQTLTGKVTRIEKFGVFVDIGAERPAMIHVSELADGYVKSPGDVVKVGEDVTGRVLKINRKKRQIDMTLKAYQEKIELPREEEEGEKAPTAMELAFRRAMGSTDKAAVAAKRREDDKRRRQRDEQYDIIERTLKQHGKR
ncbi:MAG: S1 RNA-binding domain-containing protein [Chloroflexi bacterium]|nr:S1 RNA-binding domain-containing protein [Chloroflexota bacterium]